MVAPLSAGLVVGGRFRLLDEIGSGGFGTVWRAIVTDSDRIVAVKFLTKLDDDAVRRFAREIEVLMRLRHSAILRPIDHGHTETGAPFLVTEFVDGEQLDEWMRRVPDSETVRVMVLRLADALATAHRGGVVHRDLKPANVLIRNDGTPVVLDFGIGKILGQQLPDATKTGQVLGTPGYMSPEQLRGQSDVGASTDLYALGVIAYEMLEHRSPFVAGSALEIAMKHLVEAPPPLHNAPPDLAALVLALLEKDPARRPTATAVVRQLSAHAPRANDAPRVVPAVAAEKTRPLAIVATGLVVLVLLLSLVVAVMYPDPPPSRPPPQAGERQNPLAPPAADRVIDVDSLADASADLGPSACPDLRDLAPGPHATPELGVGSWIHLPEGYSPRRKYPLVVFFHDFYQEPEQALRNIDYEHPSTQNYVFFFPRGDPHHIKRQQWTEQMVSEVADGVARSAELACVDPSQLYVIGHGRGGRGARFARCFFDPLAVATFAFAHHPNLPPLCEERAAPELTIFAMNDGTAPADGSRGCAGAENLSVTQKVERTWQRNGCSESAVQDEQCFRHDCGTPFIHCEAPGSRLWQVPYDELAMLAARAQGCPPMDRTTFPVTATIFDFFDAQRETRE